MKDPINMQKKTKRLKLRSWKGEKIQEEYGIITKPFHVKDLVWMDFISRRNKLGF